MGRPRKYPRTDYCGDLNGSLSVELNSHTSPYFQQGWNHSTLYMRSLQPHEYEQGPLGSFESGNDRQRGDLPDNI
ncbi:hypothetical protein PtB15_8B600 [Puccinia triticina]|nr:hypothetical protein PtB15_8B600 [Puccinia triticina]